MPPVGATATEGARLQSPGKTPAKLRAAAGFNVRTPPAAGSEKFFYVSAESPPPHY